LLPLLNSQFTTVSFFEISVKFRVGGVDQAIAAVSTALNRINGVLEREIAVRFQLVANNNALIFSNSSTDPYTNGNITALALQNSAVLANLIGNSNFDIGHVLGTLDPGQDSAGTIILCSPG
jgi:hypothetical protein